MNALLNFCCYLSSIILCGCLSIQYICGDRHIGDARHFLDVRCESFFLSFIHFPVSSLFHFSMSFLFIAVSVVDKYHGRCNNIPYGIFRCTRHMVHQVLRCHDKMIQDRVRSVQRSVMSWHRMARWSLSDSTGTAPIG